MPIKYAQHRAASRRTSTLLRAAIAGALLGLTGPHLLSAQGLFSVGVGVGSAVGERNRTASGGSNHAAAYLQAHPPLFPFALRADALLVRTTGNKTSLALLGDVLAIAPIPVAQPYLLLGYGRYGVGQDAAVSGWNGGVGARVRTPVIAFYAEVRRHQRLNRDLLTIGISR